MKIDTMRSVDYFAGIPLCLLATLLVHLGDFLRARKRRAPERVLFVELSEMGSAILVDPAMRKMQREHHVSFVFSSHDPQVQAAADDAFFIRDGRITHIERRAQAVEVTA